MLSSDRTLKALRSLSGFKKDVHHLMTSLQVSEAMNSKFTWWIFLMSLKNYGLFTLHLACVRRAATRFHAPLFTVAFGSVSIPGYGRVQDGEPSSGCARD